MDRSVQESWNTYFLFASFGVSFVGAYTAITLCEQFRVCNKFRSSVIGSRVALFFVAVAIGGGAMWSMHFVGMGSLQLKDSNGDIIEVSFDIGLTVISLICAVVCVYIGLRISTYDRAYSKDRNQIFAMLLQDARQHSMKTVRNKRYLVVMALLKDIGPLAIGGVITGGGVCVMHYIGMVAMVANIEMMWNAGIVASSVVIAIVSATAAFWILFRLLSLYPEYEWLRVCSALVMTIAVCGMHYTGMAAANYKYTTSQSMKYITGSAVKSEEAVFIALASGLIFCWLMSMITQSDLRLWHFKLSETIRKADVIFDDMRHVQYACNHGFISRYDQLKRSVFDELNFSASSVLASVDGTNGAVRAGPRIHPAKAPLQPVDEEYHGSSDQSNLYTTHCADTNSKPISYTNLTTREN